MVAPPLALYVHLPWCVRKCPYCDFNSHTAGSRMPRAAYLDALCADLERESRCADGRPLTSVFVGGGTPSLFSGTEIGRLLDAVRARFTLADDVEITMEANPGTVERDNLAGYRAAGVNRLSLGAQSFDDGTLERLGRIHSAADVEAAFREARRAGFGNVNLDLMYALPGQTPEMARADVERALALGPEHVSYYQLTLEPNTVFHRRPPAGLPDEDALEAIETRCHALLAAAGYRRYEISAFAREGYACRHNLNYWSFGDYLAAGAGAHGKLTAADGRILRYRKQNHPLSYISAMKAGPAATPAPKHRAPGTARDSLAGDPTQRSRTSQTATAATPAPEHRAPGTARDSLAGDPTQRSRTSQAGTAATPAPEHRARGAARDGPAARAAAPLAPEELAFEYLLNALRLADGFSERHFSERTGLSVAAIAPRLEQAAADGLLERRGQGRWCPSRRGFRFLNDLQARFLPGSPGS